MDCGVAERGEKRDRVEVRTVGEGTRKVTGRKRDKTVHNRGIEYSVPVEDKFEVSDKKGVIYIYGYVG